MILFKVQGFFAKLRKNLHAVAASVRNQNFIAVINQGARLVKLTLLISPAAENVKQISLAVIGKYTPAF